MMLDSVFVPLVPLAYTITAIPDNIAKISTVEIMSVFIFLSTSITSLFSQNYRQFG
jgi:hypothetical protein